MFLFYCFWKFRTDFTRHIFGCVWSVHYFSQKTPKACDNFLFSQEHPWKNAKIALLPIPVAGFFGHLACFTNFFCYYASQNHFLIRVFWCQSLVFPICYLVPHMYFKISPQISKTYGAHISENRFTAAHSYYFFIKCQSKI